MDFLMQVIYWESTPGRGKWWKDNRMEDKPSKKVVPGEDIFYLIPWGAWSIKYTSIDPSWGQDRPEARVRQERCPRYKCKEAWNLEELENAEKHFTCMGAGWRNETKANAGVMCMKRRRQLEGGVGRVNSQSENASSILSSFLDPCSFGMWTCCSYSLGQRIWWGRGVHLFERH